MVDRAVPLVRRRLGEGDLLDVTNVGGAEKYLASPDGAADPPMKQQILL